MRIDLAKWCIVTVAGTILVLGLIAYIALASALPRRAGSTTLAGLSAPLEIELDRHAIPRVRGTSFEDVLRGEGYLHAQERYFEMDLMRRSAAGELAALVGERALALDRAQRPYDFRRRAEALLTQLPPEQRHWLEAYTQGVNAGLADLGARPPEYWLLRSKPQPWQAVDSLIVAYAFYTMLSNNEVYEEPQGVMHDVLPPALYEFLTPSTSRFDRPIERTADDPTGGYTPLPIPGPDVVDLRTFSRLPAPPAPPRVEPPLLGPASNEWVVAATRGAGGVAMLANDPHLGLRVPNIFYRCELYWQDGLARGASIPGLPGVFIGASESLAWGATVSNADQSDWVVVEVDPSDPSRYLTPDGPEPFVERTLEVAVAGKREPERLEIRETRWGPVTASDWRGRPLALHATWLEPGGVNLDVIGLPRARTAAEGAHLLAHWAGPAINWALADTHGDIGWVVNGPLPAREGFDGSRSESWADGSRGWHGYADPPIVLGRADGELFTANNRTLAPEKALRLSRMWMRPLRAARIAELLGARERFAESDFLAMQLDTRAAGYDMIRDIVLEVVPPDDPGPLLARARGHVERWNGRADVDQPGFRILHVYYRALLERVLGPLLGPAGEADPDFVYRWPLADEPLRRVLEERPANLLTKDFRDWPTFLRQVLLDSLREIEARPSGQGIDAAWGRVNRLDVAHPFAALPLVGPLLARWLRYPSVPLPGSTVSLRVATPSYGALVRMAVAPAHPERGIMEMSGGQSGHFLSANFADLEPEWVDGAPTPFLAGATVSRIVLEP